MFYALAAVAGGLVATAYLKDGDERFGAIVVLVLFGLSVLSGIDKYGYP